MRIIVHDKNLITALTPGAAIAGCTITVGLARLSRACDDSHVLVTRLLQIVLFFGKFQQSSRARGKDSEVTLLDLG